MVKWVLIFNQCNHRIGKPLQPVCSFAAVLVQN